MASQPASPRLRATAALVAGGALVLAIGVVAWTVMTPAAVPPTQLVAAPPKPVAPAAKPPAETPAFEVKRALKIDRQMRHGDWFWDAKDVPPGPMLVTVDLKSQIMSVFRGGYEIGVAVIGHGANDKPTPLGVFPIMEKDADHYSSIYNNAPMPFMLRLTSDGVAIHGSNVRREWGTNGCVGIPNDFAKRLFDVVAVGDIVVVTNGEPIRVDKPGQLTPAI